MLADRPEDRLEQFHNSLRESIETYSKEVPLHKQLGINTSLRNLEGASKETLTLILKERLYYHEATINFIMDNK